MVGMKPAGGIAKAKLAIQYLVMLRETLGEAWLTPDWFRFGASSLANDLLMQLVKQRPAATSRPTTSRRTEHGATGHKLRFDTGWQYAPAPESTDHVRIDPQYELFIDGEFVAPRKRRYFETINPATEKKLAQVARPTPGTSTAP